MNKKKLIKQIVERDVWAIYVESGGLVSAKNFKPCTDRHKEFLKQMTEYLYENFAKKLKMEKLLEIKNQEEEDERKTS